MTTEHVINLNPTQTTLLSEHVVAPAAGVLDHDQAGTEQAAFRLPLKWKPLVQRIVADGRFGYGMSPSRLYQHAVGEMIMYYGRLMANDEYYTSVVKELRDLQEFNYVSDIQTRYAEMLERTARQGEQIIEAGNANRALLHLRRILRFVQGEVLKDPLLGDIITQMTRKDPTLNAFVTLVMESPVYSATKEADNIQLFFAG